MIAPILVVTGLVKEARIAAGDGIAAVSGGGDRAGLERSLAASGLRHVRAVVSFGIAGALDPDLVVGHPILASRIVHDGAAFECSPTFRARWAGLLSAKGAAFREATIAGSDAPLLSPRSKAEFGRRTGAAAVDMESHIAAGFAAHHGLPFGAIRIVSDAADRALPPVAGAAMRPDGSVDVIGVIAGLLRNPGQIPALVATALDAGTAFRELRRVRGFLGHLLGLDL